MPRLHPKAFYLFWWKYFWTFLIIFSVLGLFLSIVYIFLFLAIPSLIVITALVLICSLMASAGWARLFNNSYFFEVERQSLNIKWGVIIKHSVTIPYKRIQNIDVNRGIMARILGLSEVWIQTAGFSMGISTFGSLRFSEGIIPGLEIKEAEKLRSAILKKIKGRSGV